MPSARSEVIRVPIPDRGAYKLPPSTPLRDFRLYMVKPFSTERTDFIGHLIVKNGNKTRLPVTCSTTRSVNLEIVDDMKTDQFLLAFRRHCAVYGTPSLILCDNAKTFQNWDVETQKLF